MERASVVLAILAECIRGLRSRVYTVVSTVEAGSRPLIDLRIEWDVELHAESTIQNTKLQKYTRGAVTTGRAVLAFPSRTTFTIWTVYGYRVQSKEKEKKRECMYMAWHDRSGRAIRDFARPLKILSNVLSNRASSIFCVRRCTIFIGWNSDTSHEKGEKGAKINISRIIRYRRKRRRKHRRQLALAHEKLGTSFKLSRYVTNKYAPI